MKPRRAAQTPPPAPVVCRNASEGRKSLKMGAADFVVASAVDGLMRETCLRKLRKAGDGTWKLLHGDFIYHLAVAQEGDKELSPSLC